MSKSETATIRAGSLRERVRAGKLKAQEVRDWLEVQKYRSPDMVRWLENRMRVSKA